MDVKLFELLRRGCKTYFQEEQLGKLGSLVAQNAGAHHSYAMFDRDKSVDYQGVVSVWENSNPHAIDLGKLPSDEVLKK